MNLKTAITIAVVGAFAVPLAVQASAEADKIIVAQAGSTTQPKDSNPATPPAVLGPGKTDSKTDAPKAETGATAKGGFAGIDKNNDGYISRDEAKDATWSNRFTELDKDNDNRLSQSEFEAMQAGAGASAPSTAPITGGANAPDRKPSTPKQ